MQTSSYVSFNSDNDDKAQKPSAREEWGLCPGCEKEGKVSSEGSTGVQCLGGRGPLLGPRMGGRSADPGKGSPRPSPAGALSYHRGQHHPIPGPGRSWEGRLLTETSFSLRPHHGRRGRRREIKLVPGCQERRDPTSDTCILGAPAPSASWKTKERQCCLRSAVGTACHTVQETPAQREEDEAPCRRPASAVNCRALRRQVLGGFSGPQGTHSPGFFWVL